MTAVDTNILVYAHREDSPFHRQALKTLVGLSEGTSLWAIPWPCVHEFLAVVTHPRIYKPPSPAELAIAAIRQWIQSPMCKVIGEGPGYFERLSELLLHGAVQGAMVHDARIAAVCLHNGVTTLFSCDRDFSRFPALKTRNPVLA